MRKVISLVILVIFMSSCGSEKQKNGNNADEVPAEKEEAKQSSSQYVDLSKKSIPVKLKVSSGAKVKEGMMMKKTDKFTIYNYEIITDNGIIDVIMTDKEPYAERNKYIDNQLTMEKRREAFDKVVEKDNNGYIFKYEENGKENYDFYYVLFKNDRAIEFQSGLRSENYKLEEIKSLYKTSRMAE